MPSFRVIDIEQWERKEQFEFFKAYDYPFFGFTADIDITRLQKYTKEHGHSLFTAYLYLSQLLVNQIKEFRYRLIDDQVRDYSIISAGSTVLKENQVFNFCYFDYMSSFKAFQTHAMNQIEACRHAASRLEPQDDNPAQIHYSVIPWIHFTAVTHPRYHAREDTTPKIVFGKINDSDDALLMPVSVEAHHALMDGLHVGQYFEGLQSYANLPEKYLKD